MRKCLLILFCIYSLISCNSNQKQSQSNKLKSENLSIDLKSNKPNESVYLDNDTIDLYYKSDKEQIIVNITKKHAVICNKELTKDNFIEDGVKSKSALFIYRLTSNGFDINSNSFIFTIKFKSNDSQYSDIEAVFSIDLKGEFDLQQD